MTIYVTANGAHIPALGFGTFRMPGPDTQRMVPLALKTGFRHIDTAQIYGNEAEVGDGLQASGVDRADIFLTTKVWVDKYRHDDLLTSVDDSLRKLKTDYVDLLLLHWPNEAVPLAEPIAALNEAVRFGKTRHIGVSNFNTAMMAESVKLSAAPIVTNQVEYHPYLDQTPVLNAARKAGMSVTAYYAMADGQVFADPVLKDIAAHQRRSVAQVVLRWLIQQKGVIALSKTVGAERVVENFAVFDFELTPEEMVAIHALARPEGRIVSPSGLAPTWDDVA